MATTQTLQIECEVCGNRVKLPIAPNGQPVISQSAKLELDQWHSILTPRGEKFDACKPACLVSLANRLSTAPTATAVEDEKVNIEALRKAAASAS